MKGKSTGLDFSVVLLCALNPNIRKLFFVPSFLFSLLVWNLSLLFFLACLGEEGNELGKIYSMRALL